MDLSRLAGSEPRIVELRESVSKGAVMEYSAFWARVTCRFFQLPEQSGGQFFRKGVR